MLESGTDPESYITEYTLVYEGKRAWHYQNGQTETELDCLSFRAIASDPTHSPTHYRNKDGPFAPTLRAGPLSSSS